MLGINENDINSLIEWINYLLEEEEKNALCLYSILLQNVSEMCAVILMKISNYSKALPVHLEAMISLLQKFNQI